MKWESVVAIMGEEGDLLTLTIPDPSTLWSGVTIDKDPHFVVGPGETIWYIVDRGMAHGLICPECDDTSDKPCVTIQHETEQLKSALVQCTNCRMYLWVDLFIGSVRAVGEPLVIKGQRPDIPSGSEVLRVH